jgi:uncharacterized membrane protein
VKDALSYQVQQLLKENKLSVDFDELSFQIKSHSTYPSLHAVTGVLDHFNIENLALDVPVTPNTLEQLPNTFLAQVKIEEHKQFAIVTKIKNGYRLIFDSKDKKTISLSEFLNQFTGILLAVDKDETPININKSNTKSILTKSFLACSAILIGLLFINSNPDLTQFIFLTLSILGIYVTINILKQEQGETSVLGNAFCSNPTEKKNCNAVLSSKGATIFEGLKLGDMSFIYFTGLGLATFLLIINNNSIFVTQLISFIVLPITIYSVYYQALVIKKWCFLCLSIVGLMWLQASLSIVTLVTNFDLTSILVTLLSFTSIGALWFILSKLIKNNKSLTQTKVNYFKFKRNFELFNNQFNKSRIINTQIDDIEEIVYGDINSNFNITIITNPMCGHCKAVHILAQDILRRYSDSVKLTIRFNINPNDPLSSAVKITTRLLELHYENGHETSLKAMDDIYGDYTTEQWLKKWDECTQPKKYLLILQNEYSWCTDNSINFTPDILINGQSYPKVYDRKDLIYFIEDLIEQFEINSPQIPFINAQNV